jgi:hypothetical protein
VNGNIGLAALSFALLLGSAWAVTARSNHPFPIDPREAYLTGLTGPRSAACDVNPSCNGWSAWLHGLQSGVKYRPVTLIVLGAK